MLFRSSHVNKRSQPENINNATTGSADLVNAARSAMYVIKDPDDSDGKIVVHTKTNYAKYGESVKFRINYSGGVEWNGFSEIDRETVEEAQRRNKTPGDVVQNRSVQAAINTALVGALSQEACPFEPVRFTYDEFKEKYGQGIFGGMQPKKALEGVAYIMAEKDYQIVFKNVKDDKGVSSRGFVIVSLDGSQKSVLVDVS